MLVLSGGQVESLFDLGLPVEVAEFESWDAMGRRFELVTCADAWHWIDPVRGSEKAAALLRPGGTLALFWNYYLLEDNVAELFQRVYDEHAPHEADVELQPEQRRHQRKRREQHEEQAEPDVA